MEKCEWAWCSHLQVQGMTRWTGGTVLMIEGNEPVRMFWMTEKVCAILCKTCYEKENPRGAGLLGAHPIGGTSEKTDC